MPAAREHMSRRVRRGTGLSSPKATRDYLTLKLGTLEREVFAVIFLDKRHRIIMPIVVSSTRIRGSPVKSPLPAGATGQCAKAQ